MPTQTLIAGAGIYFAGSGADWLNPERVDTNDSAYARANPSDYGTTDYLSGYDYGFTIPAGYVIDGIRFRIEAKKDNATPSMTDYSIRLSKDNTNPVGDDPVAYDEIPTTDTVMSYGDEETDLWGTTWSYTEINASTFATWWMAYKYSGANIVRVDYMEVVVGYSPAPTTAGKLVNRARLTSRIGGLLT